MNSRYFAVILLVALLGVFAVAQQTSAPAQGTQTPSSQPAGQQTQKPEVPAAGGPQGDVGPIAVPKKKEAPPPPPVTEKPPKDLPQYSISVNVPLVTTEVQVVTRDGGQFIPGLKKENFRVYEDGVPQQITKFEQSDEAPITVVIVVEFAGNHYVFIRDALQAAYTFAAGLKKDDWVALVAYDIKPYLMVDFTQDKREILGALNSMRIPGFRETNLFDTMYDTLDRLAGLEGRKHIVLIATGIDTFSKVNYDQLLKKIKATPNVTIWSVATGRAFVNWLDAHGYLGTGQRLDFLQAENAMKTFGRMTGGNAWTPNFSSELPGIFNDMAASVRNQYVLSYKPTNGKQDGTFRKLKIEVVAPDGGPMKFKDQRGKDVKVTVVAREGYFAKHTVE